MDIYNDILSKKTIIQNVFLKLKEEFIGLDRVIGEIEDLVTPSLLFPDAQRRPNVINLWGLTGSGKTALVQRMVELLDMKKSYVQFDMGEFESDSSSWIKTIITQDLDHFHEKQAIITLDEFQFARSIDEGKEVGKDKLRVIWELMDSGKIGYTTDGQSYYVKRAEIAAMLLMRCYDKGVLVENGMVTEGLDDFKEIFFGFYFDSYNRRGEGMAENYFLSSDFTQGLSNLYDDDKVTLETIQYKMKSVTLLDTLELLREGIKTRVSYKQIDLSRAVIFVIGNLDEAYYMSNSMNPDISADELYEATTKINISHIKSALKKRFRNEQIARLGNNHVIYTSFKSEHFKILIRRELEKIRTYILEKFAYDFVFEESVVEIVYKEGVYPAQGTRPLYTTIKNLIDGQIGKLILEIIRLKVDKANVEWRFIDQKFVFLIKDEFGAPVNMYENTVTLKIESLRKADQSDLQAFVAVHEAGHAVVAALTLRIIPSVVVSKTASGDAEGFCMVNLPTELLTRELLRKEIMISLAGLVAEKMIFGEDQTSTGVYEDIERASEKANDAIRKFAMGTDPIRMAVINNCENEEFVVEQRHTEEAMRLIKNCYRDVELILERNKYLLLKLAQQLTQHSRVEEQDIEKCIKAYAVEEWVRTEGFIKKEDYYGFNKIIGVQLQAMETRTLII